MGETNGTARQARQVRARGEDPAEHAGDHLRALLERGAALRVSDEEFAAWEADRVHRGRMERLTTSGISERLDAPGMDAVVSGKEADTKALRMVRAWVVSPRPCLILLGDPGRGKTVAAAWALARVAGRYVTEARLCELRRNGWRSRNEYKSHVCTELLVIDELGRERDAELALEVMQDVIDNRLRLPRRTLILGNAELDVLKSRYDRATLDRIGIDSDDAGIAVLRYLRGPSMRRPGALG